VKKQGSKWGSQVSKQTMYTVPKSTNELRVHYAS